MNILQRDAGFAVYPWPCIGRLRFLSLNLSTYKEYPDILQTLKSDPSARLLDVGTCFGQDMRKLVADGVDQSHLAGLDLVSDFKALGSELFRDADTFNYDFYVRDILDDNADWAPLEKQFDILHITSFLHIWNREKQLQAAQRLVTFAKPKPGTLIIGGGLGSTVAGEWPDLEGTGTNFRQSEQSIVEFWDEVGSLTDTKWRVESNYFQPPRMKNLKAEKWADPNMGILTFAVKML